MEDVVSLPLGYISVQGDVIRDVTIKGMTAKIRKAVSNTKFRKDTEGLISFILRQCIVQIGDKDNIALSDIRSLTASDREALFVMIRRLSLGPKIHVRYKCGYCDEIQDVEIDIDDLDYREADISQFEIEKQRFIATFKHPTINGGKPLEVKMKLPNGYDLEQVSKIKDPMQANYLVYELCLYSWDGKPGPFSTEFVEDIPVMIDDWLTEELAKVQAGYDLRPRYCCEECGAESIISLEDSDFLFKMQR